jgi:hypothetical protein
VQCQLQGLFAAGSQSRYKKDNGFSIRNKSRRISSLPEHISSFDSEPHPGLDVNTEGILSEPKVFADLNSGLQARRMG